MKSQTPSLLRSPFPSSKAFLSTLAAVFTGLLIISLTNAETEESYAPYLVATNAQGGEEVTLLFTEVGAEISENVLEAQISQTYQNKGESVLECQWVFPSGQMPHIGKVLVQVNGEQVLNAGDVLTLKMLPNEKLKLTIFFTEELNPKKQKQDLI